jgi:putative DNA primase/helicase
MPAVDDKEGLGKALQAVLQHCLKSESTPRLNAMVHSAQSEPGIPILPDEMDRDHMLLNCPNGTLDLRTFQLREPRREDLITKLCRTEYDPEATCPVWENFLAEILPATGDAAEQPGDLEMIRFVQRLLGYGITGDVSEQILPVFWGKGANGKSTLLNALLELLGEDYAIKAPTDLLLAKGEVHPTERADLFGRRLVVCVETEENRRLAEVLVKELTGGDRIRARRMREDFWEFSPTHKVILCTNHKPQVRGTDHALWRRLLLVPFTVTIHRERQDKRLPDKLRAEYPGILAWLVRGCREWQEHGLAVPGAVRVATQNYRDEQDLLGGFLAECCLIHHDHRCRAGELYRRFLGWCETNNEAKGSEVPSQRKVGEALTERGFERYTNNGTWYRGLALRQDDGDEPPG